jgi:hypothetical protein
VSPIETAVTFFTLGASIATNSLRKVSIIARRIIARISTRGRQSRKSEVGASAWTITIPVRRIIVRRARRTFGTTPWS